MRSSSSLTTGQGIEPTTLKKGGGLSFAPVSEVAERIAAGLREPVQRTPLEEAWVEFLKGYEWQWFGTFTYKDAIHPEAADKQFRLWSKRVDELNGVEFRKPLESQRRCIWVRGLEWQKRGILHYHALIGRLPAFASGQLDRSLAEREWLTISGGFCRLDAVYSDDVIAYVAKYTAKGGEVDFSANLRLPDLLAASLTAA